MNKINFLEEVVYGLSSFLLEKKKKESIVDADALKRAADVAAYKEYKAKKDAEAAEAQRQATFKAASGSKEVPWSAVRGVERKTGVKMVRLPVADSSPVSKMDVKTGTEHPSQTFIGGSSGTKSSKATKSILSPKAREGATPAKLLNKPRPTEPEPGHTFPPTADISPTEKARGSHIAGKSRREAHLKGLEKDFSKPGASFTSLVQHIHGDLEAHQDAVTNAAERWRRTRAPEAATALYTASMKAKHSADEADVVKRALINRYKK